MTLTLTSVPQRVRLHQQRLLLQQYPYSAPTVTSIGSLPSAAPLTLLATHPALTCGLAGKNSLLFLFSLAEKSSSPHPPVPKCSQAVDVAKCRRLWFCPGAGTRPTRPGQNHMCVTRALTLLPVTGQASPVPPPPSPCAMRLVATPWPRGLKG